MKAGRTIQELAAELMRQKEAKADYLVDTRHMHMEAYPDNVQIKITNDKTGNELVLGMNEIAHNQLGQTLKIPTKYYDKMRHENPELLAQNVNSWFNAEPQVKMVRTLDNNVRALLSNRYRRIDNFEIANVVLPIIKEMPDANIESCEITEERMYLKVVNKRLTAEVVPGDIVQSGIMITNSEVGLGSMTIQPLVYRLVCKNGMVVNDARMRRYHAGRSNDANEDYSIFSDETRMIDDMALIAKIRDTVRAVIDQTKFDKVVDLMRNAKNLKIDSTANIPAIVELGAEDFGYSKKEGEGILDYLIRGGDLSLYGYANATTRYAQDVESYDRSTVLETIGYNILGMNLSSWRNLQKISAEGSVA